MQRSEEKKSNEKVILSKIVLFVFVLLLLFTYSSQEINNQNIELNNTAFLYEGNQLVGVNIDERADELVDAQAKKATEVMRENEADTNDTSLSTKVVSTPSIVNFELTDDEQVSTIDYAKEKTRVLEQGYTLIIDDKTKYYVKDRETIDWALEKILLAYVPDQSYLEYYQSTGKFKAYTDAERKFTDLSLANDVKVIEGYATGSTYIEEKEDLLFDLFHKDQNKTYDLISDTASIASIKKDNNLSDTVFKLNNPDISKNSVTYNGQRIITNSLNPVIDIVQTFETVEVEEIEYETVKEVDDDLLVGQTVVKTEGKNGEREITYENQMVNGEIISTEKINEDVTVKPQHKVILIGDTPVTNTVTVNNNTTYDTSDYAPSGASSGGFIWPSSSSRVTCEYGCYANHTGIDIQSYTGGPIYAAKSGVVVTSGWSNYGYGYYVVIDHGGGVQTLYAHQNQQPPVSVGQSVDQGQVIGFEGATGNVTGEHLHFEVRINGTPVNPRGYI